RLAQALSAQNSPRPLLVVDLYSGVDENEILTGLSGALGFDTVVRTSDLLFSEPAIEELVRRDLTEDRVFGYRTHLQVGDFFDPARVATARTAIEGRRGPVLVLGVGAAHLVGEEPGPGTILVLADLSRWEIQQRLRSGKTANWGLSNRGEDILRQYKRGFFIEWRVLDRHKQTLLPRIDFLLDTHRPGQPVIVGGQAFRQALVQATRQPFRLVPFFDPGPWGGQWMREVCGLPGGPANYAWCFDCVPEENSLFLVFGGIRAQIPALDLVLSQPKALLGPGVYARYGAEFPIRFDFLDTMEGGNLSLQVHPTTEDIQRQFGMAYTQDESYYILAAGPGASVYLGWEENPDPQAIRGELDRASRGEGDFPADDRVARWPAQVHDHFLIPAGTVHGAGKNTMVLEISSTPFIFTFKLWDWGRLGLDGLPRPIHLDHGMRNMDWTRDRTWVAREAVNQVTPVGAGPGWRSERTGLHPWQPIETLRIWFTGPVDDQTQDTVHVLNLVAGPAIVVESPTGAFPAQTIHYAETFVVPAAVGAYRLRPADPASGECAVIRASIRP
ncbi:MAG TPA: class I mannose-6-phosphate isomerase, partial [Spirochaetia bacterium]|nr:class I mannose-6-phosphate isomerase [Spirochaetia bacterium]